MLTHERLVELLDYDPNTGLFLRKVGRGGFPKGTVAGTTNSHYGYVSICIDKAYYKAHRLAFFFLEGEWPKEEVDHLDGDRKNNAWDNLAKASRKENARNCARRIDNISGVVGVGYHKKRKQWRARIGDKHLGWFSSKGEAVEAREMAQKGEFSDRHGKELSQFNNTFTSTTSLFAEM